MAQVSSYNVANRSGAQVRADINDIYSAIKTCNSGPNDPASPEQFMLFGDNTTGDNRLKIYDGSQFRVIGKVTEDNLGLLPRAGGTMTGQIEGDDASLADSPAYAFDNDTDTGMFRSGANTIGFSTSGTARVSISDAGLDVINGLPIRLQDSSGSPFVSLKSPSSLSGNVALTLPPSITNGGFLQTDGSGNLTFQIVNGVPTGAIFALPDTQGTGTGFQSNGIPTGYLECNGQLLDRSTFAALFNVIGTKYGNTSGSNFRVPDLRGEFIRGVNTSSSGSDANRAIGSSQGGQNASHNHSISASGTTSTKSLTGSINVISESFAGVGGSATGVFTKKGGFNAGGTPGGPDTNSCGGVDMNASHNHTVTVTGTTGSQGSEARPRNIAMMYIIKV